MKIYHVLNQFLPDQVAGTEIYTFTLIKFLQQKNISGNVIIPGFGKNTTERYIYEDVKIHRYSQPCEATENEIKGIVPPSGLQNFELLLKELKPDILHFHELSGSNGITIFHMKVAHKLNIPILLTMHLVTYVCPAGTLIRNKKRMCNGEICLNKCATCTLMHINIPFPIALASAFLSNIFSRTGIHIYPLNYRWASIIGRVEIIQRHINKLKLIQEYTNKIIILNEWFYSILLLNNIPPNKLHIIKQTLPYTMGENTSILENKKPNTKLKIIFLGRIHPSKGLLVLLKALKKVQNDLYTLDIYGTVNREDYYNKCLTTITEGQDINWKGIIPVGYSVEYLKSYDVVCIPSTVTEMSPLVIQEAFAAKTPVIASNVYGNSHVITHGINGYLFNINDSDELGEIITRCALNRQILQGLASNIVAPGDFQLSANEYIEVYQSLL